MASQFTLPTIFRCLSNELIRRYFEHIKSPLAVDWEKIVESNAQPIFEAWKNLDDKTRTASERDLQDVFFLGNDAGTRAMLTAADDTDKPLQPVFAGMENPFDRALWVMIERQAVWQFMQAFFPVDQLTNKRHWRRYRELPKKAISDPKSKADRLAEAISKMFWNKEGHGKNHKAEYHARGKDADYFSIFIDDLATWEVHLTDKNEFSSAPRPRVAEMAFIWYPKEGVARVYVERDGKTARLLFEQFYRVMFGKAPPREDLGGTAYQLNCVLEPDFRFGWDADDGIRSVAIRRMRLRLRTDRARRITLEGNVEERTSDVFDMLDQYIDRKQLPRELIDVDQLAFTFELLPGRYGRRKTLTFDINWPDGGNLQNQATELQALGQKYLERWGIDVKPVETEDAWRSMLKIADVLDALLGEEVLHHWPLGLRETLQAENILVQAAAGTQVRCLACHEMHPVVPEAGDDGTRYRMGCPIAGEVVIVDATRLNRWKVDIHAIIRLCRTCLRLGNNPVAVVPDRVWRLGKSSLTGIAATFYFARGAAGTIIDEGTFPFEPNAVVVVPDQTLESPILGRHNVRFVRMSEFLHFGMDGLVAILDEIIKQFAAPRDPSEFVDDVIWRFQRPCDIWIHGQKLSCDLTAKQQTFLAISAGKLTVPLASLFDKDGNGVWKERLASGKGSKRQRNALTSAVNNLNNRLGAKPIPLRFELPRDSEHLIVRVPEPTTGKDLQAVARSQPDHSSIKIL